MKRLICTSCEIRLPMRVDQVHWRLRLWQNAAAILRSPNLGAVVIGLVVGVARFVNSSPEDAGTIPPRPPAFQSFLDKRIHARVIDRTPAANDLRWLARGGGDHRPVAAGFSREPRERVAHSQRGEHHSVVLVRTRRRDDAALPDVPLVAAATILVGDTELDVHRSILEVKVQYCCYKT